MKKFNEEFVRSVLIWSCFKCEYEIIKFCLDIGSIIKVYDFDIGNCLYIMEKVDNILDDFVKESFLIEDF